MNQVDKARLRLDKYLSKVTDLSRSEAQKAIRKGEVTVEGEVIKDPDNQVSAKAQLFWREEPLRTLGFRYFMLHKPEGCICASVDAFHKVAADYLEEDNKQELQCVGRLDKDTTGLLLLTDDGEWSHRITSPKKACEKSYLVETAERINPELHDRFLEGIVLKGEKRPCLPANLVILEEKKARITIQEGKYHQVKRMFAIFGYAVEKLHRERIGLLSLDSSLQPGGYRPLTADEIAYF